MELKPIFVDEESGEGLYAVQYDNNELDEFERIFDLWNDAEYVHNYCIKNQQFLKEDYFDGVAIDTIESKIFKEAGELEQLLEEYVNDGFENKGRNLQMIFKPLNNYEYLLPVRQEGKARVEKGRNFPKPILRVYGIRLGLNTFVITGGAIKLTKSMIDHPDTKEELSKFEIVKSFLRDNDISTDEDLNFYYEQP